MCVQFRHCWRSSTLTWPMWPTSIKRFQIFLIQYLFINFLIMEDPLCSFEIRIILNSEWVGLPIRLSRRHWWMWCPSHTHLRSRLYVIGVMHWSRFTCTSCSCSCRTLPLVYVWQCTCIILIVQWSSHSLLTLRSTWNLTIACVHSHHWFVPWNVSCSYWNA